MKLKKIFMFICFAFTILNGCTFVSKTEMVHKQNAAETSIDLVTIHNHVGMLYTKIIDPLIEDKRSLSAATADKQDRHLKLESKANVTKKKSTASTLDNFESKVIELSNLERRKQGLPDLQIDTELCKIARLKSKDMYSKNYFSHISPTYGSPFDMITDYGISYRSAGENLTKMSLRPEHVVQSSLNNYGNRQNILSSDFTHVGIGYEGKGQIVTLFFIQK